MIWHYLKEAAGVFVIVHGLHGLLNFRHSAKAGEFRRIWNWPMRIAVVCWLSAGAFGCLEAWVGKQPGGVGISNTFGSAAIFAVFAGIISLSVFVVGFLITMLRDFRPRNRPEPDKEDIDQVQTLLLTGDKREAVLLYQTQNRVTLQEAEESVDAISAALQAGLRV